MEKGPQIVSFMKKFFIVSFIRHVLYQRFYCTHILVFTCLSPALDVEPSEWPEIKALAAYEWIQK